MGNTPSNFQNLPQNYLSDYHQLQKNQKGTIFKDSNNAIFIMKQQFILDETTFNERYKKLKKQSIITYQNILNLIGVNKQQSNIFCASSYRICQLFEYSSTTLQDQIRIRSSQKRFFQQKHIFNILNSVRTALKQLNYKQVSLSPQTIFIMNDGSLKLLNPNLKSQLCDYQIYSPERFQFAQTSIKILDAEKQMMFSLGLCILSVTTLKNYLECYDFKEGTFKYSELQQMLNICRTNYSQRLTCILSHLIQPNPSKRISYKSLEYILQLPDEYQQIQSKNKVLNSKIKQKNCKKSEDLIIFNNNQQSNTINNLQKAFLENKQNELHIDDDKNHINQQILPRIPLQQINCVLVDNKLSAQSRLTDIKYFQTNQSSIRMNQQEIHYFSNKFTLYQSNITYINYQDGGRYQGHLLQGKKQGNGKYYFKNGIFYEGNFQNDKMHGFGILYYSSNNIAYQGNWQQNLFHGYGTLFNEFPMKFTQPFDYHNFQNLQNEWIFYRGNFKYNKKDGNGSMFLANGEYYQGTFLNDQTYGKGQFHRLNNQIIKGTWKQNRFE